ncbi:MAG: HU family DNA-binding protein [Blastocatellia bacterium]|nr:HU family DNA-binding protein [Blastocatellia bacterium]MCS7157178.1 HU family DNA-binding protein [Blastocatellia bacterium]MCX7752359.1 HU family DNA-binding protein [Blastocatellia bacterium]MDW8167240.1 HU family DNA-binding protein [Acidobacteriota bacterium]
MAKKGLTKAELVGHLAEKLGVNRATARGFLDELSTLVAKEVKKAGVFALPGLGKFVLSKRKARMGRNPRTGEPIKIPAKTVLKFRIARALKNSVLPAKK